MSTGKESVSKGNILIVEDEFITAVSIQKLLEKYNYSVLGIAACWRDAEELLKTALPDLMIMDISLGDDIDGIEVSRMIKEKFDIPVIFVTAYSDDLTIQRAKQLSPNGFLIKPFDNRELYSAVEMAFVKHSAESKIKQSEKKYRDIFENIQDVYFEVLMNGQIVEVSPSIHPFTGGQYSRDEIVGRNIAEFYFESSQRNTQIETILQNGFLNDYEFDLRNKDGSIVHASVNSKIVFSKEGFPERIIGSIRNITERKINDLIMQARFHLIRFAEKHSSDELLSLALDEIEKLTGSKIGFYHFVNKDQNTLTLQNWSTNTIKNMCRADGKGAHYPIDQAGVWVECLFARKPVIHNDYESLANKKGMPEGHAKVIRQAVVPIYRDEKAVAIIGVGNKETDYDEYDINIISQIGDLSWDIVERKRAEEELAREKELLETIVNNLPIALYVKDRDGRKIITNPMDCKNIGLEKVDVIGKTDFEVFPEEIAAGMHADDLTVIQEGNEILNREEYIENSEGKKYILTTKIPYRDSNGNIIGLVGMGVDISDRILAQKRLEESELNFRHISESIDEVFWLRSKDNRKLLYINPAYEKLWGRSVQSLYDNSESFIDSALPEDKARLMAEMEKYRKGGQFNLEYRIIRPDGEIAWVHARTFPVYDSEGNIIRNAGIAANITKRKRYEEALQKRIIALTQPLEKSGEIGFEELFDLNEIQEIQDRFAAATGVASIITKPDGTPITKPSNFRRLCNEIIRGSSKGLENCLKSDSVVGKSFIKGATVMPCLSAGLWDAGASINVGGEHIANWLIGQVRDGTQTEEKMREYARQIEVDEETFIEEFRKVPVMSKEEFGRIGDALFSLSNQLSTFAYQNIQQARFITERKKFEEELELHRNHLEELVEQRTREIEEINLQLIREIEREKEIEKMLKESLETEKHLSELKSRFISTASHEFKTPLTTVLSSIELIERYGKNWEPEKYNKHIMRIKESVDNLTKLLDDVLTISRSESGKMQNTPVLLDVKELCDHFLDEVRYMANEKHILELNFNSEEKEFRLDPKLMRYVIINLLSNAIKYSPEGGKVKLLFNSGNTHLSFIISDEGIGIPPEDQNNLCEPFYRANNAFEYEGTGLGLSIVKRSLDLMNGTIKFRSQSVKGTIVEIIIPRY